MYVAEFRSLSSLCSYLENKVSLKQWRESRDYHKVWRGFECFYFFFHVVLFVFLILFECSLLVTRQTNNVQDLPAVYVFILSLLVALSEK